VYGLANTAVVYLIYENVKTLNVVSILSIDRSFP
jgi:hypothetical protein